MTFILINLVKGASILFILFLFIESL